MRHRDYNLAKSRWGKQAHSIDYGPVLYGSVHFGYFPKIIAAYVPKLAAHATEPFSLAAFPPFY